MATEKRLIDADALMYEVLDHPKPYRKDFYKMLKDAPTVDAYTEHEVAEIIAELFGDSCACNFNGIDEWLPLKCELLDACPNTCGVACWEQYLKFRDGERKDNV